MAGVEDILGQRSSYTFRDRCVMLLYLANVKTLKWCLIEFFLHLGSNISILPIYDRTWFARRERLTVTNPKFSRLTQSLQWRTLWTLLAGILPAGWSAVILPNAKMEGPYIGGMRHRLPCVRSKRDKRITLENRSTFSSVCVLQREWPFYGSHWSCRLSHDRAAI